MLRVFFGYYANDITADWWKTFQLYDNTLPQFGWGKKVTLDSHDVIPLKRHYPSYNRTQLIFDEYIDLNHSAIDPQVAEFFAQFTNQAGITIPYPIVNPSTLAATVYNTLEVDGELAEWLGYTSLLSETWPVTVDPLFLEHFVAVNETLELYGGTVVGYYSFAAAIKHDTTYGIANDPCIVPYASVGDTIRLMWFEPNAAATKIVLYRAPAYVAETSQKFLNWPQWENWRLGHNHLPIVELTPAGARGWTSYSNVFCNTTTYPTPTPTTSNWCKFKPLNNALARMNLVWQRRHSANYQMLVIDTDSFMYYKGYLSRMSPVFTTGVGHSSGKAAQFTLSLTDAGYCLIDALTAPNTSGNFTSVTRTL